MQRCQTARHVGKLAVRLFQYAGHHHTSIGSLQSMKQMRKGLLNMMEAQKQWIETTEASSIMAALPLSQSDLPQKTMHDSYLESRIPLSDKLEHGRLKYITPNNLVRFGRILEDLDTFAVACAYEHNKDPALKPGEFQVPRACWTVLVDRIDLRPQFKTVSCDLDLKLSGHVTWVGKSSMEVTIKVEQAGQHGLAELLDAVFVMVARNPIVNKASLVCPLHATSEKEQSIISNSEKLQSIRNNCSDASLMKTAPTEQERQLIHNLFLDTLDPTRSSFKLRVKPEDTVWMEETTLKTCRICFPEQKNLYDKIFGGFLMRQAFELAWANACLYSKNRCAAVAVDDIVFRAPVSIGSFLFISSQVGYTRDHKMQIRVNAEVMDPATGIKTTTNEFHFTMETVEQIAVPKVLPKSYAESMVYLDSLRRFDEAMSVRHSPVL